MSRLCEHLLFWPSPPALAPLSTQLASRALAVPAGTSAVRVAGVVSGYGGGTRKGMNAEPVMRRKVMMEHVLGCVGVFPDTTQKLSTTINLWVFTTHFPRILVLLGRF